MEEIQAIDIVGDLRSERNTNLLPVYTWKIEKNNQNVSGTIDWVGPMTGLLQKGDLQKIVFINGLRSEKIRFDFKIGEDNLGYAIYDSKSKGWKEGHVERIPDEDVLMLNVAEKMKKIIDLLRIPNKESLRCVHYYRINGDICALVKGVNEFIIIKNDELGSLKANITRLILDHGSNTYKEIDKRADEAIKFLKSQLYKEYTNKKEVGTFKKIKRSVEKFFNEITGREKVNDLYKDIEKCLRELHKCSFVSGLNDENKKVINNWKNEKISSENKKWDYFARMNFKLCKIVGELLEKYPDSQLKGLYKSGASRLVTSDANIKPILKNYRIINPNQTLKEAVVCRYVLKILQKLNCSPESKIDENTMNGIKMKSVVKKYGKVIDKFAKDENRVQPRTIIADRYDSVADLRRVCEELAVRYGLCNFDTFLWDGDGKLDKELNKRYGELPKYGSVSDNISNELLKSRQNSRYIAYSDYILTELLKDEYKPKSEPDEGESVGKCYAYEKGYNEKAEGINEVIKKLDEIKLQQNISLYLNTSSGLSSIGVTDKKCKKWNGYMKDKIKDLNSAISDYVKKYSLDNKSLEEAKFVSILYILSRSVERLPLRYLYFFAKYLKDFGGELANGFYIPKSLKDSPVVKEAGRKLYKVCYEALPQDYKLEGLPKKSCIKILECISKCSTSDESEKIEPLKALEKKIKSKLKAN